MKFRAMVFVCAVMAGAGGARAEDVQFQAAGPIGIGYVGLYYGLTSTAEPHTWYQYKDWFGDAYTTELAVADTGSSGILLGKSTLDAYRDYDAVGLPLQPYPDVSFSDVGFGGTETFAVTQPLRLMIADQKTAYGDAENHALYRPIGPVGVSPPAVTMAAARDFIGGGELDLDLIGMTVLQGRVLHVDPVEMDTLRWFWITSAGALEDTAPAPGTPNTYFVKLTLQSFFSGPQPVDVADNPTLPLRLRATSTHALAAGTALFDTGSPVNFVSESLAAAAGIDLEGPHDLTIGVGGVGGQTTTRYGYYVDALALDLAAGREGDRFMVSNSAVFVIPDADMPGGLEAILGNGFLTNSADFEPTTLTDWYVDTRDPDNSYLIITTPEPAAMILLGLGALGLLRRQRRR